MMEEKMTVLDSKDVVSLKDIPEMNSDSVEEGELKEDIREEDDEIIDLDDFDEAENELQAIVKEEEKLDLPNIASRCGFSEEVTTQGNVDIKSIPVISVDDEAAVKSKESQSSVMNFESIDLNNVNKDEAIEYLLNKKLKTKKDYERDKSKKKNKYGNVVSHFEQDKFKQNNYLRSQDLSNKDPEVTNDFQTACTKFLANLMKGSNQTYSKVMKLMIYNSKIEQIEKVPYSIIKLQNSEPNVYYNKVQLYMNKKRQLIEVFSNN